MTQAEEPRLERVVVLEGGISSEREVSLLSGRGVKEALASKGLEVESWDPAVDSVGGLEEGAYDAAFIALHGTLGEDGSVQGLLNCIGLPYTGPGVTASAIAMDKELTKNIWRANGISVPAGVRLTAGQPHRMLSSSVPLPSLVLTALSLSPVMTAPRLALPSSIAMRFPFIRCELRSMPLLSVMPQRCWWRSTFTGASLRWPFWMARRSL